MENYKNLSWDDIKAMNAETDQRIKNLAIESDKTIQLFKELRVSQKETDKLIKNLSVESEKTDKQLKELGKHLGGIANSNGEMAEEYFYNAFKADISFANEKFDIIEKNKKISNRDIEAEYDLLLFNGKGAAIIEIKYNAKPENIKIEQIISRVETFKILMPSCKNLNIYLGVAAMSFKKGLEAKLHQAGIATIRPIGKKMVKFDKDVKVF
jgi:hypothetical protein